MDEKIAFVQGYFNKIKHIQEMILDFLDKNESENLFLNNFNQYLDMEKIRENPHKLRLILHIISHISIYHHRSHDFLVKIKKILLSMKNEIKANFSNYQISSIFKMSLPIIVFLYDEKIIVPDRSFYYTYETFKDQHRYLIPQFKSFVDKSEIETEMETDSYKAKQLNGENDSYICQLIREDSVDEFVAYINQMNLSISNTNVQTSLFETNDLLIRKNEVTLIEYAAFFGSIKIFNYLRLNGAQLNSSLLIYAIHSNNLELIHLLEELHVEPIERKYNRYLIESIKCHHNEIAKYIQANLSNNVDVQRLQYYNFAFTDEIVGGNFDFLNDKNKRNNFFYDLCSNDCYELVEYFLDNFQIDFNNRIILKSIVFCKYSFYLHLFVYNLLFSFFL